MFHAAILQPNVVRRQQLIVVINPSTITTMSSDEKYAFSARMNAVAELLKIPEKGRQTLLGKKFKVSQESARKWLQGEGFPSTEKSIEIAKTADVSYEWFMTGRGDPRKTEIPPADTPESQVLRAMEHMDGKTKYTLIQITQALLKLDEPVPQAADPPVIAPAPDVKLIRSKGAAKVRISTPRGEQKLRREEQWKK